MSEPVSLLVDGRPCAVPPGSTLLEAAAAVGISIPTLCHDPRIHPVSSCWICAVEVERDGARAVLEPACEARVAPGLVVRTRSVEVDRHRRTCLELLLSDHYADCVAPCVDACPAGIDIPAYIHAISADRYADAVSIVRERNPLASICSRVCPEPCKLACHRAVVDEAVAVNPLKRLATTEARPPAPTPGSETGKHVAIVGGGPAGLAAAWFLRRQGHAVTVFDALPKAGGALRVGIPRFRLPEPVLEDEIGLLRDLGVQFMLGEAVEDVARLAASHDAVFVATGSGEPRRLGLPGEDCEGVWDARAFLRCVADGKLSALGGSAAVVGSGVVALDVARTAARLGASPVMLLCPCKEGAMAAPENLLRDATEDGVALEWEVRPLELQTDDGRLVGLVAGSDSCEPRRLEVRLLLLALPASPGTNGLGPSRILGPTHETTEAGVFAGGDRVSGPSSVIEAVASGRRAALAIDRFLRDGEARAETAPVLSRRNALRPATQSDFAHVRPEVCHADASGLTTDGGRAEARRCMQCGCAALDTCALVPLMAEYGVDPARFRGDAPGYPPERLRPELIMETSKCIRCARCVRICEEVVGVGALSMVGRGFETRVLYVEPVQSELSARCEACARGPALCADTCPTGALRQTAREAPA